MSIAVEQNGIAKIAKNVFVEQNGIAKKVKAAWIEVDGFAKKLKGVGNANRLYFIWERDATEVIYATELDPSTLEIIRNIDITAMISGYVRTSYLFGGISKFYIWDNSRIIVFDDNAEVLRTFPDDVYYNANGSYDDLVLHVGYVSLTQISVTMYDPESTLIVKTLPNTTLPALSSSGRIFVAKADSDNENIYFSRGWRDTVKNMYLHVIDGETGIAITSPSITAYGYDQYRTTAVNADTFIVTTGSNQYADYYLIDKETYLILKQGDVGTLQNITTQSITVGGLAATK